MDITVKKEYDINGNVVRHIYTIPVGNLSIEDAEKRLKELLNYYNDDSWLREYEIKLLLKSRKEKLNKLWK